MEERNAEETLVVPRGARPAVRLRRHAAGVRLEPAADRGGDANDLAMVRFHGRDPKAWEHEGARPRRERFRYDYSQEELAEWVPRIEELADQARETHVLMNNCYRDFAVSNARELGDLLDLDLART